MLREVQPVPGDAQDGLGAAPGTGCTEIKQMTTAGKFFIRTIDVAVQSSSNHSLKPKLAVPVRIGPRSSNQVILTSKACVSEFGLALIR